MISHGKCELPYTSRLQWSSPVSDAGGCGDASCRFGPSPGRPRSLMINERVLGKSHERTIDRLKYWRQLLPTERCMNSLSICGNTPLTFGVRELILESGASPWWTASGNGRVPEVLLGELCGGTQSPPQPRAAAKTDTEGPSD